MQPRKRKNVRDLGFAGTFLTRDGYLREETFLIPDDAVERAHHELDVRMTWQRIL
jgi:hypothetical protein